MSVLASGIPLKLSEDCGNIVEINCDEQPSADPSESYEVVFPIDSGQKLPISGGAVVKVDFSSLPHSVSQESIALLTKEVSSISSVNLDKGLESLVDLRLAINAIIFETGKSGILSDYPSVKLTTLLGDDSELDPQKSNPKINGICTLKFIPVEVLQAIGSALGEYDQFGASGFKFSDFSSIGDEEHAIAACIDLLPFYNISEKSITKKRGANSTGGYFTVVDNQAYMKFPDLTGRDSAGFDPDLWNEADERNLYIEILNEAKLTRISITNIEPPPAATVADYDRQYPDESSIDIILDSSSDVEEAFLSLIIPATVPKIKGLKEFDNGVELTTIPLLTKSISSNLGSSDGVFSYPELDSFDPTALAPYLTEDPDTIQYDGFSGEYGKPSTDTDTQINYILGEQNRPEILLSNRELDRPNRRNNRKYKNEKLTLARHLFAQTRPRFYETVPESWISGSVSSSGETVTATFSSSEFEKIKKQGDETYFALYLKKGEQIVRVPGENITLGTIAPRIEKISPHGFLGDDPILADTSVRISGEGLSGVNEIVLRDANGETRFNSFFFPDISIIPTASTVYLQFGPTAWGTLSQNTRYELSVVNAEGAQSNEKPIYISAEEDAVPYPSDIRATFATGEFVLDVQGGADAAPLLSDGLNAEIKVRSKSKLFGGDYKIFCYLAMPDTDDNRSIMSQFSLDIRSLPAEGLIFAADVEQELKPGLFEDFAARTKRKAVLKFPGSTYSGFNFSGLIGVGRVNFLFLNDSVENLVADNEVVNLEQNSYSFANLGGVGDPTSPAFIAPGHITALIAEVPGGSVISNVAGISSKIISEGQTVGSLFDNKPITTGAISVYKSIPRLAIIFTAAEMPFRRLRHDFLLDGKSIKRDLDGNIEFLDNGKEAIAIFRNVTSKNEGYLGLGVEVKDKRYNVKYNSSTVYGSLSSSVLAGNFSINSQTQDLTISTAIPIPEASSIVGIDESKADTFSALIASIGNGVIVSDPGSLSSFKPLTPISITSKQGDISIKAKTAGDTEFKEDKIITNSAADNLVEIDKTFLSVPSGSPYKSGEYLIKSDESEALVFNRVGITDGAAIGFKIPEIIGMSTNKGDLANESLPASIPVNQGDKVWVRVKNVKRNFAIKVGNATVKAVASTRAPGKPAGVYDAQFVVPGSLIGFITQDDCMAICASGTNSARLKAKRVLGTAFIVDLEKKMEELLFGKLKDKIPDIDDLKALLCKVPLRFPNGTDLCDISIPTELINSFCDLSFHLLADLKLALNGFQVLMIPIQIIFCIIDVLCSLVNPVKTAQAMIRLFECLFDLILLLPQISVPVMFFKLILHLLELLKCVIDKIAGIIAAINAIVPAMKAALENKDWASLKALEEVLSEYLFTLNVDLDVLAPVISILTILLQLLQLIFRFPCQVTPADNYGACSIDGTMLAGIVGGAVAPESAFIPDWLIPVGQAYTKDSVEEAAAKGTSEIEVPSAGNVIAEQDPTDSLYLTNMDIDPDNLRAKNAALDFQVRMGVSATKSRKAFKNPAEVVFQFKSKYEPGAIILKNKIIDPDQSGDSPLMLTKKDGGKLKLTSNGSFISPIDGLNFIKRNGNIKTLEESIEVPIHELNETTGELEEVGVKTVHRTFDKIPMMAILDEEFNLYFINDEGIEFDSDGNVESIRATMVNNISAPKLKFAREESELDTNGDGEITEDDDSVKVYDFPQIYLVDMRCAVEAINAMCSGASLNSFLLEEENNDDIAEIVDEAKDCIEEFVSGVKAFGANIRESLGRGEIPGTIDETTFQNMAAKLIECLGGTNDKMCVYVVNTLTTTFKVRGDTNLTPQPEFVVPSLDAEDLEDLGFDETPNRITGAQEYADGEGDAAVIGLGEEATIVVTPRDAMDIPLGGDISDKLVLEIVSDSTGDAEIIETNNQIFIPDGVDYLAKVKSNKPGEVKLRVKVCNRTIQALTYDGLEEEEIPETEVDCVDDVGENQNTTTAVGDLIKVDRIVTLVFTGKNTVKLGSSDNPAELPLPDAQTFGTSLTN